MPQGTCSHLAEFKSRCRLQPVHILHQEMIKTIIFLVFPSIYNLFDMGIILFNLNQRLIHPSREYLRERVKCSTCGVGKGAGRLHACLHCVFIGCYSQRHLQQHQKKNVHYISLDVSTLKIWSIFVRKIIFIFKRSVLVDSRKCSLRFLWRLCLWWRVW